MAPKKKAVRPPDPVRFNKLEALELLKKFALFRGILKDSQMDREVYDHFCHMNLKSRKYNGPVFDKNMRKQFAMHKAKIQKVLIPRCLAFEDVPTKEYTELKEWSLNLPHSRYLVCVCSVITDSHLSVLPPAPWPDYLDRTPTFQ